jgi:hypothetical protein
MFQCPAEHVDALEKVKARMGVKHAYMDGWFYMFLENKKFDVDEAVAKLLRRQAMERQEFAHYEVTESMRETMRSGIVEVIGEDLEGNVAVLVTTCRDFPKTEMREERKRNMDMWVSYVVRLRPQTNRCKVVWLINQEDCSLMKNTDLMFQKDMMIRISKYFPNAVHKVLLCNMSTALTFVMKPLLRQFPESISKLVEVHSSSDIKSGVLKKYFSMDVLPVCLGGRNKNVDVPEHFLEFARNVEDYTLRALQGLKRGYSIKEWEMMDTYGVDQHGNVISSPAPKAPASSESPEEQFSAVSPAPEERSSVMELPTRREMDGPDALVCQQSPMWSRAAEQVRAMRELIQTDTLFSSCRRLMQLCTALCTQIHRQQVTPDDINLLVLQTEKMEWTFAGILRLFPIREGPVSLPPVVWALFVPDVLSEACAEIATGCRDFDGSSVGSLVNGLRTAAALTLEDIARYEREAAWRLESTRRALQLWPSGNSWDRQKSSPLAIEATLDEAAPSWVSADRQYNALSIRCSGELLSAVNRKVWHAWDQIVSCFEQFLVAEAHLFVLTYLIMQGSEAETEELTIDTTSYVYLRAVESVHRAARCRHSSFLFGLFPLSPDISSAPPTLAELGMPPSTTAAAFLCNLRRHVVEATEAAVFGCQTSSCPPFVEKALRDSAGLHPASAGSAESVRTLLLAALGRERQISSNSGIDARELILAEKCRIRLFLSAASPFFVDEFLFGLTIADDLVNNAHFRSRLAIEEWLEVSEFVASRAATSLQQAKNTVAVLGDILSSIDTTGSEPDSPFPGAIEMQQLAATLISLMAWLLGRIREMNGELPAPKKCAAPGAPKSMSRPAGVVPEWILMLQDVLCNIRSAGLTS